MMIGSLVRGSIKLLVAVALFFGTLETYLAFWPDTLPPGLGNYAFSKYGAFPGGIYFHDPVSNINFMKSDFETEAYFNGYRWHHRTDALGFRNPPEIAERRVLLLGDSLIYGHGVEEVDTVAHRLRDEWGVAAYNMARQGDCIYQDYVLSRLHIDDLRPTAVWLFVFLNDFHDVTLYRDPDQIEKRPEAEWDYATMATRLAELENAHTVHPRLLLGLASARLLRGLARGLPSVTLVRRAEASTVDAPEGATQTPPGAIGSTEPEYLGALLDPAVFTRVAAYYEATLRDLDHRVTASGAELRVVHLAIAGQDGGRWQAATDRLSAFLTGTCRRLAIDCASTAELFEGCRDCFLPGDGHLSPSGHRRLAAWLARLPAPDERMTAAGRSL